MINNESHMFNVGDHIITRLYHGGPPERGEILAVARQPFGDHDLDIVTVRVGNAMAMRSAREIVKVGPGVKQPVA